MIKEIDDKLYNEYLQSYIKEVDVIWDIYQTHNFINNKDEYKYICSICGFDFWSSKSLINKTFVYNYFCNLLRNYSRQKLPTCNQHLMEGVLK